jgi:hypothetical protein
MSKLTGNLSYKDWMIIKHGVRNSLHEKAHLLLTSNLTSEKKEQIEKEVKEEKATLERIIKLTDNFKDYVKGKERHYVSDPSWI